MENKGILKRFGVYRFIVIVVISWFFIVGNCKIAASIEVADFGPYQGKIVDAETKEPIEGAVVFVDWYELHFFAGSTFIDAQETLTDKNGEFYLSGIRVFNPWKSLGSEGGLIIYKSGYKFIRIDPWKKWKTFSPQNKAFISEVVNIEDGKPIFLLKKWTLDEIRQAYERGILPSADPSSSDIPHEKKKLLLQEIDKGEKILFEMLRR